MVYAEIKLLVYITRLLLFSHKPIIYGFLKDGSPTTKSFDHLRSEVDAEEAEEVGVEHLLR